jgi:hypothetical protein
MTKFNIKVASTLTGLVRVGGAERWLFYPVVFWITGLGAYLSGLKTAS